MFHWRKFAVLGIIPLIGCASSSSATCGEGFEQQGDTCVPVCGTPCGDHQQCTVSGSSAQCECVVGYAGEPCEWAGGLQDAQFTSSESWSTINGANIDETAAGLTGPGIASFASSVTCSAGAVAQVVEMPRYEDAEPFVIEVSFRYKDVGGIDVGFGRAFRRLQSTVPYPGWDQDRFCLGEAGYGGPVKFQVAATEREANCFSNPAGTIEVDRFEILVANEGECPAPGQVSNGAANVGGGGWVFEVELGGTGTTEASFQHDVGESGSDGARLYKPAGSDRLAAMYTQLSVPLATSMPSPALRFWWKGDPSLRHYVDLGTYPGIRRIVRPLDSLAGNGDAQTSIYCLPPWTHGNFVDLSFVATGFASEAELIVDNVEIIPGEGCGDSTDLFDPSFDSAPNRWPGVEIFVPGASSGSGVTVLNDPARANPPGVGVLELRYTGSDVSLGALTWVWVPASEESRLPQLTFHSNVPSDPGVGVFWVLGLGSPTGPPCTGEFCPSIPLSAGLPVGLGWRKNTVCLPAEWAERWYRFRVVIRPSEEPFQAFDPPRTVLIDDIAVTNGDFCSTP